MEKKAFDLITFGEIMLRLSPPRHARIGSGDAYVAGVLFGLLKYGDPQKAMQFGNATSSVKNTVPGDLPSSDFKEIDRIIREHNATGPVSEMNR